VLHVGGASKRATTRIPFSGPLPRSSQCDRVPLSCQPSSITASPDIPDESTPLPSAALLTKVGPACDLDVWASIGLSEVPGSRPIRRLTVPWQVAPIFTPDATSLTLPGSSLDRPCASRHWQHVRTKMTAPLRPAFSRLK